MEIVELRLSADEIIAPVVGDAESQVKVEPQHTVIHLRINLFKRFERFPAKRGKRLKPKRGLMTT